MVLNAGTQMTGTWKEGHRDANLHMLLDADGEVIASCMYVGSSKGWCALDADGNVVGYEKTLGAAMDLLEVLTDLRNAAGLGIVLP